MQVLGLDRTQRPLSSVYCPFCAGNCKLLVVQPQDIANAFSLSNLLPAGVITVTVHDDGSPCSSACNGREWHSLHRVRKLATQPKDTLFQKLAFLTWHQFLRATCKFGTSGRIIFIRLYLIPNDLPNVSGRLHHRHETVVKEAQRHMHDIIPLIEQNGGLWNADEACLDALQKHFLPSHIDDRTMAEIYTDLPSPILDPLTNEDTKFSHHIASGGTIWGLRTALYSYQRRSVAVMLSRELNTKPVPDPLYVAVWCMSGIRYYIQPSTMTVLRECPMFSPSRAGILCEELGTGKTIMIISLILATAKQLSDPEESPGNERPVLTPLAFNHFPSAECALARDRADVGWKAIQQVPSLVDLLVHHFSSLKVTTGRPSFANELEDCHLWPLIRANAPFYHHYKPESDMEKSRKSHRLNPSKLPPRTMYLSSATLVIVPLSLLGQWKAEIDKHCYDYVRYLIVRSSMDLPRAWKLASDYELIVMSDTRFCKESNNNKIDKLHYLRPCACPYLTGSRVPDCCCPGDCDVTPLLQIRWKRLVIDEGHTAGNTTATVNDFVRQLSVQHKWIVTGTPTCNILGLQLGQTTDEHEPDHLLTCQDDGSHVRVWGSYDSLSLRKLGTMIRDFLAVPQFSTGRMVFTDHVSTPLCNQYGPQPGAINVLTQVMMMVMVRHRQVKKIKDVENDVLLPPMKHDIVYMDLDDYALKSYNAMQAALVVNAVDSEREGPDYLFHPSKTKALQAAISNSSQGLFWSSSDILYNVDEICGYADKYLETAVNRKKKPEELDLLRQAIRHTAAAANDVIWRAMQPHADVPLVVSGLDSATFEAWTRTGLRDGRRTIDVMHPDRLVNLRSLIRKKPLISIEDLINEGNILDKREKETMASENIRSRSEVKHSGNQIREMAREVQGAIEVLKKHIERMEVSDNDECGGHQVEDRVNRIACTEGAACVTRSSSLSGVKIGPSLSTKLNYILSEIQQYSVKEKFLIFSDSLLTLFQIGEALSLFEVKYLRYTTQEKCLLREQCIMTFETSDVYRVLLVSLKIGARGLNLISASRIIFCEPIWHPDVESQAIKRVHRIGQTRPVTVKTLAIRSTAEEAMIARRQYLRTGDKVPNMITESAMRQYLQDPHFLSVSTVRDLTSVAVSLDPDRAATLVDHLRPNSSRDQDGVDDDPYIPIDVSDGGAPARKRVRFEG